MLGARVRVITAAETDCGVWRGRTDYHHALPNPPLVIRGEGPRDGTVVYEPRPSQRRHLGDLVPRAHAQALVSLPALASGSRDSRLIEDLPLASVKSQDVV